MASETVLLEVRIDRTLADAARDAVTKGAYASVSDVLDEALRDWQERDADRQQDTARIKAAIEQAANDPVRISIEDARSHLRKLYDAASAKTP